MYTIEEILKMEKVDLIKKLNSLPDYGEINLLLSCLSIITCISLSNIAILYDRGYLIIDEGESLKNDKKSDKQLNMKYGKVNKKIKGKDESQLYYKECNYKNYFDWVFSGKINCLEFLFSFLSGNYPNLEIELEYVRIAEVSRIVNIFKSGERYSAYVFKFMNTGQVYSKSIGKEVEGEAKGEEVNIEKSIKIVFSAHLLSDPNEMKEDEDIVII